MVLGKPTYKVGQTDAGLARLLNIHEVFTTWAASRATLRPISALQSEVMWVADVAMIGYRLHHSGNYGGRGMGRWEGERAT